MNKERPNRELPVPRVIALTWIDGSGYNRAAFIIRLKNYNATLSMVNKTSNTKRGSSAGKAGNPLSGEVSLTGIPVSPGVAMARVCMFSEDRHAGFEETTIPAGKVDAEKKRLANALESAKVQLSETSAKVARQLGPAEAEIFTVQRAIMDDASAQEKIRALIETERINAEAAVQRVFSDYEQRFAELSNDYMRERAGDIAEAKRRLLDALTDLRPQLACEGFQHCRRGSDRIIVARELSPALTVELDTSRVRGFVTAHGGATSHAAILARALGVPSVSGVKNILDHVGCGVNILVDGHRGRVILRPTPQTVARYPELKKGRPTAPEIEAPLPDFTVMANINLASAARAAQRFQADGIGLYRTEFEHIVAGRMLDEEEQYQRYTNALKAMEGRQFFFRLLDMGGDKGGDLLGLNNEENPSLGLRGARLLLQRPQLLEPQARALARAAIEAPFSILYPMIVDTEQFLALRQRIIDTIASLAGDDAHPVRHGVMFEVPSACLQAEELLRHADFGSIGTNDLAQYLFAADRDNENCVDDLNMDRPVFWQLIGSIVEAAQRAGKPLSVCGELASETNYLLRIHQLGLRSVSVNIQGIAGVRRTIRNRQKT